MNINPSLIIKYFYATGMGLAKKLLSALVTPKFPHFLFQTSFLWNIWLSGHIVQFWSGFCEKGFVEISCFCGPISKIAIANQFSVLLLPHIWITNGINVLADYWPENTRVCGFWFLPMEWQFSCQECGEISTLLSSGHLTTDDMCLAHADLQYFLKTPLSMPPIFVGLSSIGR